MGDEHVEELAVQTETSVAFLVSDGVQSGVFPHDGKKVFPPFTDHQRAVRIDRVAVILGGKQEVDAANPVRLRPKQRLASPEDRNGEDVRPTWPKDPRDLLERGIGTQHVLEDILGHEDVDRLVWKGQVFETFAPDTVDQRSRSGLRKILGARVTLAVSSKSV